jgi:sulfoxide reductase heme-binding subunit YedZ
VRRLVTAAVFLAASTPLLKGGVDALRGGLGANPIEAILNRLGFWALTLLVASLAPTALDLAFGWKEPLRHRRMLGLFAFSYALLHLLAYVVLDQFFDVAAILEDVVKRKFITVGFAAFLLLVPLALTSTNGWVRRLGFVRWKRLHRLAYGAAVLGVVHFVWRVKADLFEPLVFGAVLAVLLAVRLAGRLRRGGAAPGAPAKPLPVNQ